MPRLSIVIPALGGVEDLESSLISILSNRPDSCEVVVVLNRPYDDPYQLTDEVRFVDGREGAGWAELAARGLETCQAPLVHFLAAGVEVAEDWTSGAIPHFDDPHVVAVSPLILDRADPSHVLATGVDYDAQGRRALAGAGMPLGTALKSAGAVLGPTRIAGFYRRSLWQVLLSGFDAAAGEWLADADIALRARYAGLRSLFEPRCRVFARADALRPDSGVRAAFESERLYWRNLPAAGGLASVPGHGGMVAREFVRGLPRPIALARLLARLVAMFDLGAYRRYHDHLRQVRRQAHEGVLQAVHELRVDRSHGPRRVRIRVPRAVTPSTVHRDA